MKTTIAILLTIASLQALASDNNADSTGLYAPPRVDPNWGAYHGHVYEGQSMECSEANGCTTNDELFCAQSRADACARYCPSNQGAYICQNFIVTGTINSDETGD